MPPIRTVLGLARRVIRQKDEGCRAESRILLPDFALSLMEGEEDAWYQAMLALFNDDLDSELEELMEPPEHENFFKSLFTKHSKAAFKSYLRVSKHAFWNLHSLIKGDPALRNGTKMSVWDQLATFLYYFGSDTSTEVTREIAAEIIPLSEAEVLSCCRRITQAFINIRAEHVVWPDPARRQVISRALARRGFPGCIGIMDSFLIRIVEEPDNYAMCYWCPKKYFALRVGVMCDHEGRYIGWDVGWPGGLGYALTQYTIRPFNRAEVKRDEEQQATRFDWNLHHARVYKVAEHANGRLLGRFRALQNLPGKNIKEQHYFTEALLIVQTILHNFGERGDEWDETTGEGVVTIEAPEEIEINNFPENWDENYHGDVRKRKEKRPYWAKARKDGIQRREQLVKYAVKKNII